MEELTSKHCKPCEGGVKPLNSDEAQNLLQQLNQWSLSENGKQIYKTLRFKNYYETIAFVNALAWFTHKEDHHPDLEVGYNRCTVRYTTHAIEGLSNNDYICAAKIDALIPSDNAT